jgi:hypothetical protein
MPLATGSTLNRFRSFHKFRRLVRKLTIKPLLPACPFAGNNARSRYGCCIKAPEDADCPTSCGLSSGQTKNHIVHCCCQPSGSQPCHVRQSAHIRIAFPVPCRSTKGRARERRETRPGAPASRARTAFAARTLDAPRATMRPPSDRPPRNRAGSLCRLSNNPRETFGSWVCRPKAKARSLTEEEWRPLRLISQGFRQGNLVRL